MKAYDNSWVPWQIYVALQSFIVLLDFQDCRIFSYCDALFYLNFHCLFQYSTFFANIYIHMKISWVWERKQRKSCVHAISGVRRNNDWTSTHHLCVWGNDSPQCKLCIELQPLSKSYHTTMRKHKPHSNFIFSAAFISHFFDVKEL